MGEFSLASNGCRSPSLSGRRTRPGGLLRSRADEVLRAASRRRSVPGRPGTPCKTSALKDPSGRSAHSLR
ncbi:hypothetical protein AAFF_G00108290 [Aldrovandia affinis]|uniref:Uncharacterized protein n=1 Tax=Aldrovandia affinis TaxID=143900 RepID=A0AAD7RU46_9TELE|nr:hypothetical protein AAFF_G00108290 [Aldrovandia affinis]